MIRFLALAVFLTASSARAGGYITGNGGHLVICPAAAAKTEIFHDGRTLLDLYEGRRLYGWTYKKLRALRGLPLDAAFERAMRTFFRDAMGTHVRARFRHWFASRSREIVMKPSLPLWAGGTSWSTAGFPCELEQGLIQYLPRTVGTESAWARLVVSAPLWRRGSPKELPSDLKVALLIHEYLYRLLRMADQRCALKNVRIMTAHLLSDQGLNDLNEIRWRDFEPSSCRP